MSNSAEPCDAAVAVHMGESLVAALPLPHRAACALFPSSCLCLIIPTGDGNVTVLNASTDGLTHEDIFEKLTGTAWEESQR